LLRLTLILVVVLPLVAAAVYFEPELRGAVALEIWAKNKPLQLVAQFNRAVRDGDVAAAQALSPGAEFTVEGGAIKAMKPPAVRGGPGPFDVRSVLPPLDAAPQSVKYMPSFGQVQVIVRAEDGGEARILLGKPKGTWQVVWFAPGESVRG
jgi:hypothetical protein